MQYTAQELYKVATEHRKSLDDYLDNLFQALHAAANQGLEHYNVPFDINTCPPSSDVLAALKSLGFYADIARNSIPSVNFLDPTHKATSATLNIGWGPGYVIGGDSSLLN
jgi:hypothetical protein